MKTLSIGIPAYNEEKNIGLLIETLLKQKLDDIKLLKITVISDCSTDKTDRTVNSSTDLRVNLVKNIERKGKAFSLDRLFSISEADVVVIIDADTVIKDTNFLQKLVSPILNKGADLTAAQIEELPSRSFVGQILDASMKFKKNIYYKYKNGQNVYTCCGRARAFSKKLYKSIKFGKKFTSSEDAYSYIYCNINKFTYYPVVLAKIYYKLPQSLPDHISQSMRFFNSKNELTDNIDDNILKTEYYLPTSLIVGSFLKILTKYPIILFYIPILVLSSLQSKFDRSSNTPWEVAISSKNI
ncbi:hypothetical protein A3A93_00875 [Candidatus Roizmanbacteria bacterium RIFCSPLOWO2_01_FULL_38_12]|uniref:Glycosyltransferase 2-like domain-containing protein n=1 Tax=Candidatus Roizmanbacteria bacterium RIFCSPLOWO2_01_FULL_38_12 TaxID=1802061 RepID=A0A1F7IR48_9BACT|nr:MAG: hypothetical protein A3F59_05455 [Candidatus Roizmanbacteria bacterium RIFCSPHIGHO2_12_FULL_38_13]OGK45839.1 MAG: hypothetical protein A3A93_00875 [Candidatus Roizmanbacteria bacterium RIFCSPLOWO2_01_FULL_38_12]